MTPGKGGPYLPRLLVLAPLLLPILFLGGCDAGTTDIGAIQGAGHRSPLEDQRVTVRGVVVAEGAERERPMCWIEGEDDGDPATSRGLFVLDRSARVGRRVRVTGTVRELGGGDELPVTALVADEMEVLGTASTPVPVVLSFRDPASSEDRAGVRRPPGQVIEDDAMERFDPATDGLDFWESLEGMRVRLPEPVVVGPTHRGSFYAVAGPGAGPRTRRGGLRLTPDDENPEKILVVSRLLRDPVPPLAVGDGFAAPIEGVVHYRNGHYGLLPVQLPRPQPATPRLTVDVPGASSQGLRIGSANVLNLSRRDRPAKFRALAQQVVDGLGSPHLLALQEVQDDSGDADDGTVGAEATLGALVRAIGEAGGPAYAWTQVDPRDGADGGRPGGNIRVVFLHDPSRLERLGFARLEDEAFSRRASRGWEGSRKPLVASFRDRATGEVIHAANLHLRSKGGDDRLWGARQPPRRPTEEQRVAQARAVAEWAAGLLRDDADARVVVVGDLNEYPWRPPLQALADAGLVNLIATVEPEERYTYVYRGNSLVLDHILVSPALAANASLRVLHANADLPLERQVSDHDPLVASFD